jgi:hypothetical protein
LRKRELSNAKKKLKMSRQWNDNGVMKKHVKSSEKRVPVHTMVEDIDNQVLQIDPQRTFSLLSPVYRFVLKLISPSVLEDMTEFYIHHF